MQLVRQPVKSGFCNVKMKIQLAYLCCEELYYVRGREWHRQDRQTAKILMQILSGKEEAKRRECI